MPSLYAQTWTPIILTEARFYKKYETIVFMTQMANKKEVWFPCQGGRSGTLQTFPGEWLIQYSDLRWRSMWLGLDCHKRHLGLTFCQADPWRTCSVCGFTGLCHLFSWEALRRKTLCRWLVCGPLSSTSFPSPSPPLCPAPCLTTWSQSLDSRSLCSPIMSGSYSCSLHSRHIQMARSTRSWHCRSSGSSGPCRDPLI